MRDVHAASLEIARQQRNPAFVISPTRLHHIETKNVLPSIYRVYTLATVYGRTRDQILDLYEVPMRE